LDSGIRIFAVEVRLIYETLEEKLVFDLSHHLETLKESNWLGLWYEALSNSSDGLLSLYVSNSDLENLI